MIWVYVFIMVFLIGWVWLKRQYKKDFIRCHKKELSWCLPIAPGMLWITDWWYGKEWGKREENYIQAVYIRQKPEEIKSIRLIKIFACVWYCVMIGCLALICMEIMVRQETVDPQQGILRPTFGQEEEYTFFVDGLTDQTEEITVTVEGMQPGEEVMAEVFDEIMEKVKVQMLGDNSSLDEVRNDLNLPTVSDYGVRLEWKSDHSDLVNDWGEIQQEKVQQEVKEEGVIVTFSVRLTYASYESNYEIYVRIMPPVKDEEYMKHSLISEIDKREKETIKESVFYLPDEIEDKQLFYEQKSEYSGDIYFFLIIMISGLFVLYAHSKLKEEYEDRNRQIQKDYVSLLAKMGILLRAGLTIRGAWERMVKEYERIIGENPDKRRYVYEEMVVTWNQIRNGYPETTAYLEFGRRCGTYAYVKFGNILEQNLKQGITGISQMLEREMTDALEERKNVALRRGEEAQTKLLFPMFLLLGIVLVMLLVPAFLSFG